jgi:hypothetical protein
MGGTATVKRLRGWGARSALHLKAPAGGRDRCETAMAELAALKTNQGTNCGSPSLPHT